MQYAPRDEVLLPGLQWNPLPIDDERIAALNDNHVFVIAIADWARAYHIADGLEIKRLHPRLA